MSAIILIGLFAGRFLNVCIDRLPKELSIITLPSRYPICGHKLGILDFFPVFSYLLRRGRCRYCQTPIPLRLPIVEGVTGLMFGFLYREIVIVREGTLVELGVFLIYACLLIVIFVIDLEHQLVLNRITYPAMALAFSFFWPGLEVVSFFPQGTLGRVITSLLGGALGLNFMALSAIIYRTGWGLGDVKLGALIGLMTGFPLVFAAWLLSVISGGLLVIILLTFKIKNRQTLPFAPFMTTSAMVTLLWGHTIWEWYLP